MARKRKIIVYISTSADGYIARPNGSVEWLERRRPKANYGMDVFYRSIDTILWGRKTYDLAIEYAKTGFQSFPPELKHYAFSRGLPGTPPPRGVQFVQEPIKDFATRLRAKKGKNIWMMGGGGIIASFLDAGAIDEFIIHVVPIFIGEGIPLIAPQHRNISLKLIAAKPFSDGVVRLHYAVR